MLGFALGQSASPPETPPAHWGPVSINLEDVPYPYPVQFRFLSSDPDTPAATSW